MCLLVHISDCVIDRCLTLVRRAGFTDQGIELLQELKSLPFDHVCMQDQCAPSPTWYRVLLLQTISW